MANLVSRFVQKIFLDDARQEDVAEEATKQQNNWKLKNKHHFAV